jgi:signal transduction histidine kinase
MEKTFRHKKTAVEMLSQSEASLNAIIENVGMVIYSLDREFRYTHFNSHLKKIVKQVYNEDIEVGDVVFDFLYKENPLEADEWRARYARALGGEALQFVKETILGEHHSFFKVHINPIREKEEVIGLACVAIDISTERLAELQQERTAWDLHVRNHTLEQYSYIVAHNLRGPIANLLGIANLLEMEEVSRKDKDEAVSHIMASAQKLDDVICDLSNILQAKEQVNLHRESISFADIVDDVTDSIQSAIVESGALISTDFSDCSGMITIKAYLHSIFYNLISNSIRFARPGIVPMIKIRSRHSEDGICLTFQDNGLGFDTALYGDKIFGLYNRFHPQIAEGKGMGLFMVKTHVETLGGTISISSDVGTGTTFSIQL